MTDYEQLAARYDAARAVPLESLLPWRDALAPLLSTARPVLDVGAGTGLWSSAFARRFGARVVAVEPSAAMPSRAITQRAHPDIAYLCSHRGAPAAARPRLRQRLAIHGGAPHQRSAGVRSRASKGGRARRDGDPQRVQ